jgi:hypothetical protein
MALFHPTFDSLLGEYKAVEKQPHYGDITAEKRIALILIEDLIFDRLVDP